MLHALKQQFSSKRKDNKEQRGKVSHPSLDLYYPTHSTSTLTVTPPKAPRDDVSAHARPRRYPGRERPRPESLEDLIFASQRLASRLAAEDGNPTSNNSLLDAPQPLPNVTTRPSTRSSDILIRANPQPTPIASSSNIKDQHVNSVIQDNPSAGPSAAQNRAPRHEPTTSTAMASSSVIQPPGYRPASPSLLEGFDDMDTLPTARPAQNLRQPPAPPVVNNTSAPAMPRFRYQLDPTLLSDFADEDDMLDNQPTAKTAPVTQTQPVHLTSTRPAARRGYGPVAASILGDFDDNSSYGETSSSNASQQRPQQQQQQQAMKSNNPYVKVIEARQNAMTVAYLRNSKTDSGVDLPAFPADDVGFGERYQRAGETTEVTNQRVPIEVLSGEQECIVCTDTKPVAWFPAISISKFCTHAPTTCLVCVAASIRSDLDNRLWNEIRCPECRGTLEYEDVQRYADDDTKTRYQDLTFRHAMSESPHFIWCTAGCGSGQIHESGSQQPIVACVKCEARSCFHHSVPWHENLSCEEYDALLADPENFRSRFEIENDEAATADDARRAQEDADRAYAQSLMAEEQRVVDEERRERARREEEAREARRRQEREEQQRKLREQRKRAAVQLRQEEESQKTVARTTKPCPGCGWAIEKNAGCSHMTCIKCSHQFCYDCLADHREVLEKDNSAHQPSCPWHPDNLEE